MASTVSTNGAGDAQKSAIPELGKLIIEGKTKRVNEIVNSPGEVFIESKDKISAFDGAKVHELSGKAAISTATATKIFELLSQAGIKNSFIRRHGDTTFIARHCDMIPIEFVTRRVATGSFLKRNPGVQEGYRFNPPKMEYFYKDDANHDPQWSREQIIAARMKHACITIGATEVDILSKTSVCIFEILERAWASLDCALIDMKIEFGVDVESGELLLSDIIDSDSWRLWKAGDRRLQMDKQVYRDAGDAVTGELLQQVKVNFQWVAERALLLMPPCKARIAIFMGSTSDKPHCEKIREVCQELGIPCEMRVTSAHKGTEETMALLAQYEGAGIPTVFIAVAGRSNGLGPVLSGNATWPVINCPPVKPDWGAEDIWSSLRLPSGLGCTTVISPEAAALQAAQILALSDHMVWSRLRSKKLNTAVQLMVADKKLQAS